MEEKELSGEDSLRLINRMIAQAKGYFHESGITALVYGFTVLICSLLTYLVQKEIVSFPFAPFYIMVPVFFIQAGIQLKEEKKKKAKTFTDEAIDFIWLAFFLSAIIALAGIFAGAGFMVITIILFLSALATFATGMITRFLYHSVCGVVVMLMAASSFFLRNENIYFLLAAAATIIWIIPGFMLRAHFKKQLHGK